MAQTGDVAYGKHGRRSVAAGTGGSDLPDLPAEFSAEPFEAGTVGMARSMDPNSANSQFFIMFAPAPHLDGQYTVVGQVIAGQDVVDAIKRGDGAERRGRRPRLDGEGPRQGRRLSRSRPPREPRPRGRSRGGAPRCPLRLFRSGETP